MTWHSRVYTIGRISWDWHPALWWDNRRRLEERRPFRESYYRIIEKANELIDEWYRITYHNWHCIVLKKWNNRIEIWQSNSEKYKWYLAYYDL